MKIQNREELIRLPETLDKSLKAFASADDYILRYIHEQKLDATRAIIAHDRFGYIACNLLDHQPQSLVHLYSQRNSTIINAEIAGLDTDAINICPLMDCDLQPSKLALLRMPKSLGLLEIYLHSIVQHLDEDGLLVGAFMTKHFAKGMLDIAARYFGEIEQSLAWKKSRLILMRKPKKDAAPPAVEQFDWKGMTLKQYPGVFSSGHVDYATEFLLSHLTVNDDERKILDIGCGNGIIANFIHSQYDDKQVINLDDSIVALHSAKLNLDASTNDFMWQYNLDDIPEKSQDLIITNPPFHFEYEIDASVAQALLKKSYEKLRPFGRLFVIANRHLDYFNPLFKTFRATKILASNTKFNIFECKA